MTRDVRVSADERHSTVAGVVRASQAVGDRFGLHTTDLEVLDLIFMRVRRR
jgi:hypothetical protein